ncbi:hypothetical protein TCAL_04195 [Tigriopus californicus]|uniref:Dihydrolipoamide acetyltransferase component of pyruvate dehydrogenase complex n=1 Tax=Tigriopus californicus TaxID=6832 RepID=A0A553N702_TIGCA|nr:lipoamide acyltransferase component of branched-chain alpha-keto acid dehydrogenase complex, mitochondrial-like [Tigriopus californicus]TRY61206.1 hypothetical protein TCAL_04195 [Tigriopus californicus]|eukprot:TCALIF_04195-PA protein Name:"Similar to Dbt Lipoamide acyltransferase component of branched-chain alpha-keto acid dehydrogenase complex, mitochondrial (Mus musculus)" AED:0.04 eAED:0.05 QI:0/0/0/1/1/1/2/0/503
MSKLCHLRGWSGSWWRGGTRSFTANARPALARPLGRGTLTLGGSVGALKRVSPVSATWGRSWLHTSGPHLDVVQFHLSDIGEGIKEVTIKEWFVQPGDTVAQFDQICEVQSDKASVTITSRFDGVIRKLYHDVDGVAQTGDPLVDIEVDGPPGEELGSQTEVQETEAIHMGERETLVKPETRVLATPAVRRIASEHSLNLADIAGTGKAGRVLKEDVIRFMEEGPPTPPPVPASPVSSVRSTPPQPTSTPATKPTPPMAPPTPRRVVGADEKVTRPMDVITKAMTKAMTQALEVPHFGYKDEIDMSALVNLRQELKRSRDPLLQKLSFMPFMIKAASLALHDYPNLNASVDVENSTIIQNLSHNIAVAMDTPMGLIVPNIKKVQDLTLLEVAGELLRLQELASAGKLGSEDLKGGTFTLSNIGSIGGTYAIPVINPPQVAIGAIGKIQVLPRFNAQGEVIPAHIMCISWSADHRIVDGAAMARFSNKWKACLENPSLMTLYMK